MVIKANLLGHIAHPISLPVATPEPYPVDVRGSDPVTVAKADTDDAHVEEFLLHVIAETSTARRAVISTPTNIFIFIFLLRLV